MEDDKGKAAKAQLLAKDAIKLAVYAESFGGPLQMTDEITYFLPIGKQKLTAVRNKRKEKILVKTGYYNLVFTQNLFLQIICHNLCDFSIVFSASYCGITPSAASIYGLSISSKGALVNLGCI